MTEYATAPFSRLLRPAISRRACATAAFASLLLGGCSESAPVGLHSAGQDSPSVVTTETSVVGVAGVDVGSESGAPGPARAPTGAQSYVEAWGPPVGSQIPMLAAVDHTGRPQTLESLRGGKGLLLVFSRSADW